MDNDEDSDNMRLCVVGPSRVGERFVVVEALILYRSLTHSFSGKTALVTALEEKPFKEKYFSTVRGSTSVIVSGRS